MKTIKKISHQTDNIASFVVGAVFIIVIGMLTYSIIKGKQEKKETTTATKQESMVPTQHTVKENESLWSIAEVYYKSGYNWVDLARVNTIANPDYITIGQILVIPDVKQIIIESGQISAAVAPKHAQVTVQQGDSLWKIAVNEYGSGYAWTEIARLNSIPNPDLIYPGTILTLSR